MQRLWILGLIAALLLAACGGDDGDDDNADAAPTAETADVTDDNPFDFPPDAVVQEADATEEVQFEIDPREIPGQVMQPGLRSSGGVEIVGSRTYSADFGISWAVFEVQNTNANAIPAAEVIVSLLDSNNRFRDTANAFSGFIDIPPGAVVPVAVEFPTPPDFTDIVAIAGIDERNASGIEGLQGEFDFPATLDPLPTGDFPLVITGTVTNDREVPLQSPVFVIAFYDATGQILAAAPARFEGLGDSGEWLPASELSLTANLLFAPEAPAEARVFSAAYRQAE